MPHLAVRNSAYVNCAVCWNFTINAKRLLDTVTVTADIIVLNTVLYILLFILLPWTVTIKITADTEYRKAVPCTIPGDHMACLCSQSGLASAPSLTEGHINETVQHSIFPSSYLMTYLVWDVRGFCHSFCIMVAVVIRNNAIYWYLLWQCRFRWVGVIKVCYSVGSNGSLYVDYLWAEDMTCMDTPKGWEAVTSLLPSNYHLKIKI